MATAMHAIAFAANDTAPAWASCGTPEVCEQATEDGDVGLAFGLTIIAGLSTTIGSLVPFFSSVKRTKLLASALGVAAGVMLYVSFVEIFVVKSVDYWCCVTQEHNYLAATMCFFGGIAFTALIEIGVHAFERRTRNNELVQELRASWDQDVTCLDTDLDEAAKIVASNTQANAHAHADSDQRSKDSDQDQQAAEADVSMHEGGELAAHPSQQSLVQRPASSTTSTTTAAPTAANSATPDDVVVSVAEGTGTGSGTLDMDAARQARLRRMGLMTGIAIGIHNFPEGLATFVATLADSSFGVALCIAIALHNIPEGVSVSLPVYFATGSRWKGFLWSLLSGVSEPIGALLGWVVLKDSFGPTVYAVMFGVVGGMMVYIVVRELLPTAHRYDPEDRIVTVSMLIGMMVMAASLLMFQYV